MMPHDVHTIRGPKPGTGTASKARQLLKLEKTAIEGEREAVEADLGPVRYLATPIGTTDEVVMRYFILVVALPLDPAAVLLLLAAI